MKYTRLIALAIVVVSSALAIASAWHDSPIVDEIPHIGAAYGYVFEQSYQFNPEHPPLAKDLAGLGLLFGGVNRAAAHDTFLTHSTTVNDQWNFGQQLLYGTYHYQDGQATTLVHAAKLPLILFFIFSGLIIFIWTRKLYGDRTALLALFLFSFSPTVLAHARFVTTDLAALFGILLATYLFVQYLQHSSRRNFWLAVVGLGVALLCKFSTFLLIPFFILLAIGWAFAHRKAWWPLLGRTVLIMVLAVVVIVGPYYQLHLIHYPAVKQQADTVALLGGFGNKTISQAVVTAAGTPVLRPFAEYGLGLLMVTARIEGGNRIYFLGEVVNQGGPWYFPIVYVLKEPIPFLLLLLTAIGIGLMLTLRGRFGSFRHFLATHFPQAAMLLWLLIYWVFSINSTVNIGIRHLMPIYGFTAILVAGAIMDSKVLNKKVFRIAFKVVLVWYAVECVYAFPSYLSYFNELAGGPAGGHHYVTDSNLDWGQDLERLGMWVQENNVSKIDLDYFGWADQQYYIGPAFNWMVGGKYTSKESYLKDRPQGGYVAVSATYFEESIHSSGTYLWLKDISPVTTIGNSIYVWHITP